MSCDWPIVKLSEIVNLKTGRLDSNQAEEGGSYPFFTCSPATLAINTYAFDDEVVLLAGNNANGVFTVKYYKGKFNAYQRTYVITPIDSTKVSVRWLYFRIKHVTTELQQLSVGSATKFLTKKILDAFEIALPPYEEQEKIADVLWSLQNKLDNGCRINQTLESMAQAIFKSWFVDFEPVKAKIAAIGAGEDAEGVTRAAISSISGKTNEELDQLQAEQPENYAQLKTTAELFPSSMEDSELGEIPEGWEVKKLSDICIKVIDGTHDSPKPSEDGYYLVTGKNIVNGFIDFSKCYKISQEDHKKVIQRSKPEKGDIIFSNIGTLGSTVLVDQNFEFSIKNVALFKPLEDIYSRYLYLHFSSAQTQKLLIQKATGTTQIFFSLKFLRDLELITPPKYIISKFDEIVQPFFEERSLINQANQNLCDLRDSLLPKLLSGELSVDAAKLAEE